VLSEQIARVATFHSDKGARFAPSTAPVPGESRTVRMWVPADDGRCNIICITYRNDKPVSEQELHNWRTGAVAHAALIPGTPTPAANRGNDYNIDRAMQNAESFTGIVGIRAQDAAMTESPGPIVDRSQEHLGTSDTAIIKMRRLLIDGARNLERGVEPTTAQDGALYRVRSHSVVIDEDVDFDERPDIRGRNAGGHRIQYGRSGIARGVKIRIDAANGGAVYGHPCHRPNRATTLCVIHPPRDMPSVQPRHSTLGPSCGRRSRYRATDGQTHSRQKDREPP